MDRLHGPASAPDPARTAATRQAIQRLLHPRSVAIVGASGDAGKTAGRPVAYLHKHGYAGAIYPVNPRLTQIGALPCYPDVAALPEAPDVAIVLLGAERSVDAVRALAARGTAAAIVLASGFGELGEAGRQRQQALLAAAGDMRLLGPNTIGLVNLNERLTLSASSALELDELPQGRLAVVSQSGGILSSLLSRAAAQGLGFSKLVSTSNEADLDLADFVDWLVDDPHTQVIALYMESLRQPAKFMAAAARARAAGKPIVAYKVGRSESGARATVSHTGALAGSDRMYDALFRHCGVLRAERFSDLLDLPCALLTGRALGGRRVAILTSTGGAGTLVADSLGLAGFDTPIPDLVTAGKLLALQQGEPAALDRNPIDVTLAGLQPELLRGAIRALLESERYDAVVVVVGSSALAMPDLMAGAVRDCLPLSPKPVLAYVSPHAPVVAQRLLASGVPAFSAPEACTAALMALQTWAMARAETPTPATGTAPSPAPQPAQGAVPPALPDGLAGPLNEAQARHWFAAFGIPSVREQVVPPLRDRPAAQALTAAVAGLGERLVLKVLSRQILHKSDVGGVAVGLTPAELPARLQTMADEVQTRSGHAPEGFVVQEMLDQGVELILGLHHDPLGSAILLGMGGVSAELLQDTTLRLLPPEGPLSPAQALQMLQSLRSWPLLNGYRNRPPCDVPAAVEAIVAFSRMAWQCGQRLREAEINPLFVLPRGQGVRAADGVLVLA